MIMIAIGGALGSVSRLLVSARVHEWMGLSFPFGTLVVNVAGCFLIGVLAQVSQTSQILNVSTKALLVTGFLGAFTTFSTFGYETIRCLEDNGPLSALFNVVANVTLGVFAVGLGMLLVKAVDAVAS